MNLSLLQALSFLGAERLLLQEGYVKERCMEEDDKVYERKCRYPYSLYDDKGKELDRISYIDIAVR